MAPVRTGSVVRTLLRKPCSQGGRHSAPKFHRPSHQQPFYPRTHPAGLGPTRQL